MRLYHYTSPEHLAIILQTGFLKRVESNVSPRANEAPDVVWLTTNENATQRWQQGSAVDKGAVRITVDVPDAHQWETWSAQHGITPVWYDTMNRTGGGDADLWYVACREIRIDEFEEIRFTRQGPLAVIPKHLVNELREYVIGTPEFKRGFHDGTVDEANRAGRPRPHSMPILNVLDTAMRSTAYRALLAANHDLLQRGPAAPHSDVVGRGAFRAPPAVQSDDPLVMRYLHEINVAKQSGLPFRNTRAWEAIAEKRVVALWLAETGKDEEIHFIAADGPNVGTDMSPKENTITARDLAFDMINSDAYLWRAEIERIAMAAPLPRHTVEASCMPQKSMFWSRETANAEQTGVDWFYLLRTDKALLVVTNTIDEQRGDVGLLSFVIRFGGTFPDDYVEEGALRLVAGVLQRLAFMNSRYTATERRTAQDMPREIRREYARKKLVLPEDEVSVVTLRRPEPKTKADGEGREVDWAHSWWVSPHWRNQAMGPGYSERQMRWIPAYIKGPDDKPMLERVYRVVR